MLGKLFENKFFKNITMLVSGTAFAQVLSIVLSPIITRIYPPEQYGVLTVYTALLAFLSIGASLDYQKAIPLAKSDDDAYNLLVGALLILKSFVFSFSMLLLFFGEEIMGLLNNEILIDYMYLIPIGILFLGTYNILTQWSLRTKDFKTITITKFTQSILSNGGKIGFGMIGFGPAGLIVGHIIGQSGGVFRLSSPLRENKNIFFKALKWNRVKALYKRYIKFPLYSAPSNYVYTAGSQAPIIILSALFGTTAAGLYGLANTIINLPINLLATSVSQVFYAEAASIGKSNPEKMKRLLLKLSIRLVIIALVPLLIFVLLGPFLFSLVFGPDWYEAGVYARILAFVAFTHFVILPSGRVLEVMEKQNIGLIVNIIRLIFIIFSFIIASLMDLTALQTVTLYAVVSSTSYLILFIVVQRVLKKQSSLLTN